MEKFNPSIIVHNGEGLTLTLVPNEKVFDTTKDDVEYELKFKDLDVDNNNEVKYVNGEEGRERIRNEVFLGAKKPEITLPLDGSNEWNGVLEYSVNAEPSNVDRVIYTISDSNDFSGNILETEIDKNGTRHVTSTDKLFERYGPDKEIYMRIKVILINQVSLYSSTVRTRTVNVKVEILEPQEGSVLSVQSKVKVTTNLPANQLANYQYKLIFRSLSNSDYAVPVTDINNITVDFKAIIKHFGSDVEVTTRFEVLKNSALVSYDENRNRTPELIFVKTVIELVNYLNSGEQPEKFDTSGITDMSYFWCMLTDDTRARDLSGLENWDMSNVRNMECCFGRSATNRVWGNCVSYIHENKMYPYNTVRDFHYDLSSWNVSNVTNMNYMFTYNDGSYTNNENYDISNWNTSNVRTMKGMFYECSGVKLKIKNWDTSNVTDMSYMFGCTTQMHSDISTWDTSNVRDMSSMFRGRMALYSDITGLDVSSVENMDHMFYYCFNFNQPIGNWNVSNVTNMNNMFDLAQEFDQDISMWNVYNVRTWNNIFQNCPISSFHKPRKFI